MNTYRYRRNKNKGFTLAELLIVVAITIILAAVGFIAIFQYQQNLKFTEMENDAREVFLAAQNSLTSMKENGVELNDDKNSGSHKMEEQPGDYPADSVWETGHEYRYVTYDKNNNSDDAFKDTALGQILDFGSVDDTIRKDGSYIIEYDKETYTVYAVFYTDKGGLSDYYPASLNSKDVRENKDDIRKKFGTSDGRHLGRLYCVGYYGPGDQTADKNIKLDDPKIFIYNSGKITYKEHSVKNGNKSKAVKNSTKLVNDVDLSSDDLESFKTNADTLKKELKDKLVLVVAKPDKNFSKLTVKVTGDDSRKSKTFTYLNKGNNKDWNTPKAGNANYKYLILDDVTDNGTHFSEIFDGFIPGENISVTAQFESSNGSKSRKVTLPANSLFDDVKETKDKSKTVRTAQVRSPRQLQNLEPQISNINNESFDRINTDPSKSEVQSYTKISQVKVTDNIDWNKNGDIYGPDNETNTRICYYDKNSKKNFVGDDSAKQFLSVNNPEIKNFDGNNKTISNLNVVDNTVKIDNNTTHYAAGLFGEITSDLTVQDLTLEDPTVNSKNGNAGSLIGRVSKGKISISNVSVSSNNKNVVISGNSNAGGLIGYLSADAGSKIENVHYEGGEKGLVKTDNYSAGGLIGMISSKGLNINNSYTSTYVYSGGKNTNDRPSRAGGFIGYITQASGETEIKYCFYGGRIKDSAERNGSKSGYGVDQKAITDDPEKIVKGNFNIVNNGESKTTGNGNRLNASAGGFIGSANGDAGKIRISNSFTTGSVFTNYGPVGGFVGQSSSSEDASQSPLVLTNTYATGAVDSKNSNSEKGYYAGRHPVNPSSSNNHYLNGVNSGLTVIGDDKNNSDGKISGINDGAAPFTPTQRANNITVKKYADDLKDDNSKVYPFSYVSDLTTSNDNTATLNEYVGDWPIVEPIDSNYAVDNGNKLTFHIALPADTVDFTMAVQGLADIGTSPRVEYAPFHIVRDANGNITSVQWVNFFQSQWFNWSNGWYQYEKINDCQIAHVESAGSFNAAYRQKNGSDYISSGNEIYFAVDLDDLSKNQIYEAGPFVNLFTRDDRAVKLYPGEDICVRVKTGIEKFDISSDPGITANSIYADGSNGSNNGTNANTALIANSRHLENLNMNLSGMDSYSVDNVHYTKARQTMDIIWNDNDPSTNDYISDIKTRNGEDSITTYWWNGDEAASNNSFYPVYNTDLKDYDGKGYTLKNMAVDMNVLKLRGTEPGAVFQEIAQNGSIHDLTLENLNVSTPDSGSINAAGLIGKGNGLTLENITVTGTTSINVKDYGSAGGIVSELSGNSVLNNCVIKGDKIEISSQYRASGLVGSSSDKVTIKNSSINADSVTISASSNAGGFIAEGQGTTEISDSELKSGNLSISSGTGSSGGLIGVVSNNTTIKNNYLNEGIVHINSVAGSGGLIGSGSGEITLNDNEITGTISIVSSSTPSVQGHGSSGGAIGKLSGGSIDIDDILFEGSSATIVASGNYDDLSAGGLVGSSGDGTTVNINNSAASAYILGQNDAGGLVGRSGGNTTIKNSYAGGHTSEKKYQDTIDGNDAGRYNVVAQTGYAGGLVGNNNTYNGVLSYDKVFTAASVKAENNAAGGIFGHSVKTELENNATSYVIGLVSGNTLENTGAYTGRAEQSFNVQNAYYLPELYLKRNLKVDKVPKDLPYGVNITGKVEDANFDNDKTGVDAKDGDNFAQKTSVYDSQLNGSDYPFKVWTTFNLSDTKGRVYVGDWEPANMKTLNPKTDSVRAVFQYQDPQTNEIKNINGSYAEQSITVGKATKLTLPLAPSFSAAGTNGNSYEPDSWHVVTGDSQLSTDSLASGTASTIKVTQNVPEDLHVALTYKKADTKYKVTFTFTNPDNASDVKTVSKLVNPGDKVAAPSKDFNGYKFDGWTDDNGNVVDPSVFDSVNGNISVHANYHKIEKFTVTIQFMHKDNNVTEPLSQQPYVLTGIKGERLSRDVTLPSINGITPQLGTAVVTSGDSTVTDASGNSVRVVEGPTQDTNGTRIKINADADTIISVYYEGNIKASGGYTIQHIFEDTASNSNYENGSLNYDHGETYTYSVKAQQDIGLATGANALDVTGFEAEPFTQEIVKDKNPENTVVKIYYKRRSHHVIYRSEGGSYIEPATFAYGQPITDPAKNPTREGYDFSNWTYTCRYTKDTNGNNIAVNAGSAMPDEDVIATAGWTGKPSSYKILYWLENADDNGYSPVTGSEITETGTTGNQVQLDEKYKSNDRFEGFKYKEDDSDGKIISGDGSTVVNVYYIRLEYTVNFYAKNSKELKDLSSPLRVDENRQWSYLTIKQDLTIPAHPAYKRNSNSYVRVNEGNRYQYYYVGDGKGNSSGNIRSTGNISAFTYRAGVNYERNNPETVALMYYLQYNQNVSQTAQPEYFATKVLKGTDENGNDQPVYSFTCKYGYNVKDLWPGNVKDSSVPDKYKVSRWLVTTDYQMTYTYNRDWFGNVVSRSENGYASNISQSGLNTMPLGGADFILPDNDQGNVTYQTVFHYEQLDGSYVSETVNSFRGDLNDQGKPGYYATPEDHYDVTGYHYDETNPGNSGDDGTEANASPKQMSNDQSSGNYQYTYQWDFYYKRNEYTISFNDRGTDISNKNIKYEADISNEGNEAEVEDKEKLTPPGDGYTFGGWYTNSELQGNQYVFTGKTMPAGDLVFYAKWNPPVHTVTFNANEPSGLNASYNPAQITGIEQGKSIEDQMTSQGNLSDAYIPELQNADGTPNSEYNFTGWYTDQACTTPFVYASGILKDTTLYAGWEHVAGQRNITVNYKYRYTENGNTTETDLGQDVITGDIGQPLTINAKVDIGGYYPQQTQRTIIVESEDANPDQSVTFYYNKVQFNWKYRVNYNVLYDNDQKSILVDSKEYDPKYYEMKVVYGSEDAPVPDNLKGYRLVGNSVQTVDAERAVNGLVTVDFNLVPDTDLIDLEDGRGTYDGTGQKLKDPENNLNEITSSDKNTKIAYSYSVKYGYRNAADDVYVYKDEAPVNAGIYPAIVTLNETVTNGNSKENYQIALNDDSDPVYLTVDRRKITLTSQSLTKKYDGNILCSNDENINYAIEMKGTWIVTDKDGKKTGESSDASYGIKSISFAANAFRVNPGEADNAFDYELSDNINELNYDIRKSYGKLTVTN